jgi:penicillin-binding protein 2
MTAEHPSAEAPADAPGRSDPAAAAALLRFRTRVLAACFAVLLGFGALVVRLVWLEVLRYEQFDEQAVANSTGIVPIVPNRGLILDRNGIVLASNYAAYTLEITPSRLAQPLDRTIAELSQIVPITPRDKRRFDKLLEEGKSVDSIPIRTKLTDEEVAKFTAAKFRFPGVDINARLFRSYPWGELASHAIGYIGRINETEQQQMEDWPEDEQANYRGTQYIGKLGIEQNYERQLHGVTGAEQVLTMASGRAVRELSSDPATAGNTIRLTLDIKLQKLVEDLYGDRRGALVALDPGTGEVLAFVSKPTFDPNLFVDGIDPEHWQALNGSPDKPLLNRALRGTYSPGSTYKPYMALIALETGKRRPEQAINDPGYFWFGNHKFRDDKEGGHGVVNMYKSIVASCDTYYYMLANDLGVDTIHDWMKGFGFGQPTGIDIPGESRGVLPSTEWKRLTYKTREQQKWYAGETISLGIGQGYNNFTIVQLATAVGTLANNGVRMKPHLLKQVIDEASRKPREVQPEVVGRMNVHPENLAFVQRAMVGVTQEGTSAGVFKGAGYISAGKTGTAQVVGLKADEKYHANTMDERLRDHALYIAYAPADHPKIALAMVVENGGFGAAAAAPIARRVFDYMLRGQYPREEDMAAVRAGQATVPIGTPRGVDAAWPPAASGPGAPLSPQADPSQMASLEAGRTMLAAFQPPPPPQAPAPAAAPPGVALAGRTRDGVDLSAGP